MQKLTTPSLAAEFATLRAAVRDYLTELDNPTPDYLWRCGVLRDKLRQLTGTPKPDPRKQ
jgi:hypothetical protein